MPKIRKATIESAAKKRTEKIKDVGIRAYSIYAPSTEAETAYKEGFGPYLSAQAECSDEVLKKGLRGYEALREYAACMATKMGPKV